MLQFRVKDQILQFQKTQGELKQSSFFWTSCGTKKKGAMENQMVKHPVSFRAKIKFIALLGEWSSEQEKE